MAIKLGLTDIADAKLGTTQVDKIYLGTTEVWSHGPAPAVNALKFSSAGAQTLSVDSTKLGTITPSFEYSTNNGSTWSTWNITSALSFGSGTTLYIRGMNSRLAASGDNYTHFVFSTSEPVACSGNIMHLFDYTQDIVAFTSGRGVKLMFEGCTQLTSAPELPATTLLNSCYQSMFQGCTSLVNAPALPATVLKSSCYASMFQGCTSLETIPSLVNGAIQSGCFNNMFYGCSKIKMSLTQDSEYANVYSFAAPPGTSFAADMFTNTGGTFTGTPNAQTYYTANTIVS